MAEAARLAGLAPEWQLRIAQEQAFHQVVHGAYADGLVALTRHLTALEDQESVTAASLLGNLAQTYAELQRWDEAENRHRRAVEIRRRRQPDSLPLTELLAGVEAPGNPDPAVAHLTARLAAVRDELRQLYSQLGFHPAAPLTGRRAELEQLQESLRVQLRAAAPDGPDREHEPPCSVAQIQACLDRTTVFALYEVTDDGVFAWVIRTTGFVFTRLAPEPEELVAAVGETLAACRAEEAGPPVAALRRLGEWLLKPLTGTFDNLVICAGDVLAYLPFEALERDGAVLADRCVLWSVPSATTVVRFGARRTVRRPDLGFAVPRTEGMRPLPSAAREVRDIAALFPGRSAERATLAAVRADASASRYVHFAAHGVIDDAQPFLLRDAAHAGRRR